jgi:hypothetical protein
MGYKDFKAMSGADVHHHREADDLRRCLETSKDAGVAHAVRLADRSSSGNPIFI